MTVVTVFQLGAVFFSQAVMKADDAILADFHAKTLTVVVPVVEVPLSSALS